MCPHWGWELARGCRCLRWEAAESRLCSRRAPERYRRYQDRVGWGAVFSGVPVDAARTSDAVAAANSSANNPTICNLLMALASVPLGSLGEKRVNLPIVPQAQDCPP